MSTATFSVGTQVTVKEMTEVEYKRPPVYSIRATGTVDAIRGTYERLSEAGEAMLYSVRFDSADIWGEDADRNASVYVDLWEDCLESASNTSAQQHEANPTND